MERDTDSVNARAGIDDTESWILATLGSSEGDLPVDKLLTAIRRAASSGDVRRVEGWLDLLLDAVLARKDKASIPKVLALWATWRERDTAFAAALKKRLLAVLKDRLDIALVNGAGLGNAIPFPEAVRRLNVLFGMKPGALCVEKNWGVGSVVRLDEFYGKATIDFEKKAGHQMSLAYAGESLELVPEGHFLAMRFRDAARLKAMAAGEPDVLVRLLLHSMGPLSVPRMKELICPSVLPESGWKDFWDAARKKLRQDPCVQIPSKRNDPVTLTESADAAADVMLERVRSERDPVALLGALAEMMKDRGALRERAEWAAAARERYVFMLKAAAGQRFDLLAKTIMQVRDFAAALDVESSSFLPEADGMLGVFMEGDAFVRAGQVLTARDAGRLIRSMAERDPARTVTVVLEAIGRVTLATLGEIVDFLREAGKDAECAARFSELLRKRDSISPVVAWSCRHLDILRGWGILSGSEFLNVALDSLEEVVGGEWLRAQNQVRAVLSQREWMENALEGFTRDQRLVFLKRVEAGRGMEEGEKRAIMAQLIRLFPDLTTAISEKAGDSEGQGARRVTSWRTFRERQAQLKELSEVTIPANSRDIAQARSYGDLRENFEYQAARDQQRLLLRREEELQTDLKTVTPSDFVSVSTDQVNPGLQVTLLLGGGSKVTYHVLGEWDRDEALNIISNRSKLGESLLGHKVGEEVNVWLSGGEERARIESISQASAEVRAWLDAGPRQG